MTSTRAGSRRTYSRPKAFDMSNSKEDDNPHRECGDFRVNLSKSDLVNIYVKEWVLKWCQKYHPEAFFEAEGLIKELLDCSKKKRTKNKKTQDSNNENK